MGNLVSCDSFTITCKHNNSTACTKHLQKRWRSIEWDGWVKLFHYLVVALQWKCSHLTANLLSVYALYLIYSSNWGPSTQAFSYCFLKAWCPHSSSKTAISPSFLAVGKQHTYAHWQWSNKKWAWMDTIEHNSKNPPCCRVLEHHTKSLPAHFKMINKTSISLLLLFLLSLNEWNFPLPVVVSWWEGTHIFFQCNLDHMSPSLSPIIPSSLRCLQ